MFGWFRSLSWIQLSMIPGISAVFGIVYLLIQSKTIGFDNGYDGGLGYERWRFGTYQDNLM